MRVPSGRCAPAARERAIRFTRGFLAAIVSAALVAVPAGASAAAPKLAAARAAAADSIGVQLLDIPVGASTNPRALLYIVDHLHPGTVIHRRIEVSNTTSVTMPTVLYPGAAAIGHGLFLGAAAHTANDLSSWISVRPGASGVPAGGHVTATVTITVPRDAAPGERYGVIWAETRSTPPSGGGITEVSRVGIRVYLSVGHGAPPATNFTIDSLSARRSPDGQPIVIATVHNTGGRALDMSGTLELTAGPGGLRAGPFPANLGVTLAIGDTTPVTIVLDPRLPAGPWNARVTLHSGLIEHSTQANIIFPDTGATPPPYLAITGLVVLLLGVAGPLVLIRRRRKPTATAQNPKPHHQAKI